MPSSPKEEFLLTTMITKIRGIFTKRKINNEKLNEFKLLLYRCVADGQITDDELAAIRRFADENSLDPADFERVQNIVFNNVLENYMADRRITEEEEHSLMHLGERLGLAPSAMAGVSAQINYYSVLNTLETCSFEDLPASGKQIP
jgi:hypothetical protein